MKSEQPTSSCKRDFGDFKEPSNNSETSHNKLFNTDGKQSCDHKFSEDRNNGLSNDEPNSSTVFGGHTENVENLQKRKGNNLRAEKKDCHTSLTGDKPEHDADFQFPKFASRSKKDHNPNSEQTNTAFQTHRSKYMGRKSKETGFNGSFSTERRKCHSPISQLRRRKSREKVESLESVSNGTARYERTKKEQAKPWIAFSRLRPSFSQLKKTGNSLTL